MVNRSRILLYNCSMGDVPNRRISGSVFSLNFHLVWCPNYRRKLVVGGITDQLRSLLHQKAQEVDVTIEALEIMSDHTHLFKKSHPTDAPQRLRNRFRETTSLSLRLKNSPLRFHLPIMCGKSNFIGSISHVFEGTVKRYIEMQKSS